VIEYTKSSILTGAESLRPLAHYSFGPAPARLPSSAAGLVYLHVVSQLHLSMHDSTRHQLPSLTHLDSNP